MLHCRTVVASFLTLHQRTPQNDLLEKKGYVVLVLAVLPWHTNDAHVTHMEEMMELFLQQLLNGLTIGGVYSLVALGLTLVYGIL